MKQGNEALSGAPLYKPGNHDEGLWPTGDPRPEYEDVLGYLRGDPAAVVAELTAALAAEQVHFGGDAFRVDPVPRLITSDEWWKVSRGLEQRARALVEFVRDVYSVGEIIEQGLIDSHIVEGAELYEPDLFGAPLPTMPLPLIGFDLVRGDDGELRVLEDNARTPSGIAYSIAAREALDSVLPAEVLPPRQHPAHALDALGEILQHLADEADGILILLSEERAAGAFYEHEVLAEQLRIPIVERAHLRTRGGNLYAFVDGHDLQVGAIYRRTNEDRIRDAAGDMTWVGETLLEPIRSGRVKVANSYGAGVADDKLVCSRVEEMIRFYLGEEPVLSSIRTLDPAEPEQLPEILERLGELVVKPRSGLGGERVMIGALAEAGELVATRRALERDPGLFVAQETVALSTHPTVEEGRFVPRHVDLRVFVVASHAVPCALTRVAFEPGEMVVNSSRGGGAKDTWIAARA